MTSWQNGLCAVLCPFVLLAAPLYSADTPGSSSDLEHAVRSNDLVAVQKLVALPGAAATRADRLKSTPLHYAAIYGNADSVRILLAAGADPNVRNQAGATPLIYAAWNLGMTQLMVEHGADVNAADLHGATPLMVAAAAHRNADTVRYLIEKGAKVGALDERGDTALTRTDLQSDRETVMVLLAHGADGRSCNRNGINALEGSVGQLDTERVRTLLKAGADPNQANQFGGTVRKGPLALVHLTPLMLAAPYGDSEMISLLLQAGARVNETDIRKMTPLSLSIATDYANVATVKQLIAAGADVNATDNNGESALTWARKYRDPEILAALESAGARGKELAPAPQPEPGSQAASVSAAIQRTLPLLAASGRTFFHEGGCAGCHHAPAFARAYSAAAEAGLPVDPDIRKNFLDSLSVVGTFLSPNLPVMVGPGGDIDPLSAYLASYADLAQPADAKSDLMVHYIAVRQDPGGTWTFKGLARPPIEDSTITRTALAIQALKKYGWPARQAEFNERIARARRWLETAKPVTTYERADQIAGLAAAGVPLASLRTRADELLRLQRADGGWAQTRFLDSDAYATGLVLHTLYAAGLVAPRETAYQHGVQFLLRTQFRDGSWYVRSRAVKFQPYFQSGFPFNHDQWISSIGTSLAAMALAPAAADETQALR